MLASGDDSSFCPIDAGGDRTNSDIGELPIGYLSSVNVHPGVCGTAVVS